MSGKIEFENRIDNYEQTIQAIVGFINFFRYDTEKKEMRREVIVFQGRRFSPSTGKSITEKGENVDYVTPDIGILLPTKNGVIGEVKRSFPSDQNLWHKTFKQIMNGGFSQTLFYNKTL